MTDKGAVMNLAYAIADDQVFFLCGCDQDAIST